MPVFPQEIFLIIVESIDNRYDLLSFALTCRVLRRIIIPNYLDYVQISSWMEDKELWEYLLQKPYWCTNTQRLELTNDIPGVYYRGPSFQRIRSTLQLTGGFHDLTSNLYKVLPHMVNLGHIKFSWTKNNQDNLGGFRTFLDALVDTKCRLKEVDLTLEVPDSILSRDTTQLQKLQIWTKLDLTALRKLFLRFQGPQSAILYCEVTYINSMLPNAKELTHLTLTIEHIASLVKILQSTWLNLENLTITTHSTIQLKAAPIHPLNDPSTLTDFLKRHPKLTTLSLPAFAYITSFPPYLDILPNLVSISYNWPIRVPLCQIFTPATLRRLRHLTIAEEDPSLSNEEFYMELTSLETCYIKGPPLAHYGNIKHILKNLSKHVTTLQKICLPHVKLDHDVLLDEAFFETLTLLQHLPNLTHLAGVPWATDFSGPQRDRIFQILHHCHRLKYVNSPSFEGGKPFCAFRLTRESDDSVQRMLIDPIQEMTHRHCDQETWGGFYRGMEC